MFTLACYLLTRREELQSNDHIRGKGSRESVE
jgi:hypothetical protein